MERGSQSVASSAVVCRAVAPAPPYSTVHDTTPTMLTMPIGATRPATPPKYLQYLRPTMYITTQA